MVMAVSAMIAPVGRTAATVQNMAHRPNKAALVGLDQMVETGASARVMPGARRQATG
jgi:hypothetical protein